MRQETCARWASVPYLAHRSPYSITRARDGPPSPISRIHHCTRALSRCYGLQGHKTLNPSSGRRPRKKQDVLHSVFYRRQKRSLNAKSNLLRSADFLKKSPVNLNLSLSAPPPPSFFSLPLPLPLSPSPSHSLTHSLSLTVRRSRVRALARSFNSLSLSPFLP